MKVSRFVYRQAGLFWLVLALLVNAANAGTPGKCDAVPACVKKCGSSSRACKVQISYKGAEATATIQNFTANPNGNICVYSGTKIKWSTKEDGHFTVAFGTDHPFTGTPQGTKATFKGDKANSPSDKTIHADHPSCYQYNLELCIDGQQPCKTADPKVIVTNVRHP
jgi:hypothetical protein